MSIVVKNVETYEEYLEMWKLNCDVFCRELGQHAVPPEGYLVDRFHAYGNSVYRIGWDGHRVCGMLSAHLAEPFSVVAHFGETMSCEIIPGKTAEIRLFAVRPEYRRTHLPARLAAALLPHLQLLGVEKILITAISSQQPLYHHLGFRPLGAPVQDGNALFYPMSAELKDVFNVCSKVLAPFSTHEDVFGP